MKLSAFSALLLAAAASSATALDTRPNFIIMQPDDLHFFEEWTPPPHQRTRQEWHYPANSNLPNMNRLRLDGLQMMQAYTASPKCGTSRYSTMTGRYPSRSSVSRTDLENVGRNVSQVSIPTTKLEDRGGVDDGEDCTKGNLAALFRKENYHTGVVGKWHLLNTNRRDTYTEIQDSIRMCGFDYAEAIYKENLGAWTQDLFHHNMEYITSRAISFIEMTYDISDPATRRPFFLYANPTVPHSPDVFEALVNHMCGDTPEDPLNPLDASDPVYSVPGMTAEHGGDCVAYRQTILDRAGSPPYTNNDLGSIWVDDSIGAILKVLEDRNELDNTFFLFQQDHGQEGKDTLWEQGARIHQVVHFPNGGFARPQFHGVVSTIDIGPTMLDFAGIDSSAHSGGWYDMDGSSWKEAAQAGSAHLQADTCVVSELDRDRSVVCGCDKYMRIHDVGLGGTADLALTRTNRRLDFAQEMHFDLCRPGTSDLAASPDANPEENNIIGSIDTRTKQLSDLLDCHIAKTNPSRAGPPDYSICGIVTSPAPPTTQPTPSPTSLPTPSPTPAPTNSPTEADITPPEITNIIPAPGMYLGDVANYVFMAEVTDTQSSLRRVNFEFEDPSGSRTTVAATLLSGDVWAVNHALFLEGVWRWRINAQDQPRNTNQIPFQSFSVAHTASQVVALTRNDIEEIIANDVTLAAKFIRMGFHDCVGGCDGCVDMGNGDNAGLDPPIDALDSVVTKFGNADVSRADIWALASLTAADVSQPGGPTGRFPLTHVGRVDCPGGDAEKKAGPDRHLPSPDLTTHEILDFFNVEFGFDAQETVAIMGAHTLGKLAPENSGFDGQWVNRETRLDNAYYSDLVGGATTNVTDAELIDAPAWPLERVNNSAHVTPDRTHWVHIDAQNRRTIMTSSDIALVRDLNNGADPAFLDKTTGEVTCQFKSNRRNPNPPVCPMASQTIRMVAEYKHDNDLWVNDFESVMHKMMVAGYDASTTCPDAVCVLGVASLERNLRGRAKLV